MLDEVCLRSFVCIVGGRGTRPGLYSWMCIISCRGFIIDLSRIFLLLISLYNGKDRLVRSSFKMYRAAVEIDTRA